MYTDIHAQVQDLFRHLQQMHKKLKWASYGGHMVVHVNGG